MGLVLEQNCIVAAVTGSGAVTEVYLFQITTEVLDMLIMIQLLLQLHLQEVDKVASF